MIFSNTNNDGSVIVMSTPKDASLDDVLAIFTDFLRANGYIIDYDKYLDFVNDD